MIGEKSAELLDQKMHHHRRQEQSGECAGSGAERGPAENGSLPAASSHQCGRRSEIGGDRQGGGDEGEEDGDDAHDEESRDDLSEERQCFEGVFDGVGKMKVFDRLQRVVVIRSVFLCSNRPILRRVILAVRITVGAVGQLFFTFAGVVALAVGQEVTDVEVVDAEALERFVDESTQDGACCVLHRALGFRDSVGDLLFGAVDGLGHVLLDRVDRRLGILSEAGQGAPKIFTDRGEAVFGAGEGRVKIAARDQTANVE